MSHRPDTYSAAGPECFCGSELKAVPLPDDIRAIAGHPFIWVHVHNGDTRCYPESMNAEERAATGEPA